MFIRAMLLGIVGFCASFCAAEEFPYTVYINSPDVYVRSGPGKSYYPTDKLQKGDKVEVWRHDPGGWYAIRPTHLSYSWVATRQLEPAEDGLAVVSGDRVVARVGSSLSETRDVIQVRLDKGEKVEVIGTDGTGSWTKIAPPPGEFRWIYHSFADSDMPDMSPSPADRQNRLIKNLENAGDDEESLQDEDEPVTRRRRPSGRNTSSTEQTRNSAGRGGKESLSADNFDRDAARDGLSKATRNLGHARPSAQRASSPVTSETLPQELDAIELDLSAMAAEDIAVWTFFDLRQRAEAALPLAQTATQRGKVRLLMDKIKKFEEIKHRHTEIVAVKSESDRRTRGKNPATGLALNAPRYDGIGRLAPVVSKKAGAPQFALVDSRGAVTQFITPAPGVNLRPYEGQQIGVTGPRAFMTDLQKQHINVQHVTVLDSGTTLR